MINLMNAIHFRLSFFSPNSFSYRTSYFKYRSSAGTICPRQEARECIAKGQQSLIDVEDCRSLASWRKSCWFMNWYRIDEYDFLRTFLLSFAKLIQSSQNSCQEQFLFFISESYIVELSCSILVSSLKTVADVWIRDLNIRLPHLRLVWQILFWWTSKLSASMESTFWRKAVLIVFWSWCTSAGLKHQLVRSWAKRRAHGLIMSEYEIYI